ncbi:exonuclease SbcCD subunit D [Candidatus Woesearchaeota archaeon]|nr:exonuclease SbcCD subunit D [Candidatus Woesearchaeota archaeon]
MKFAHMSDCHIGSWQRTPKLTDASIAAFEKAMDICVETSVDFILISGDLFDTSIPAVDKLKEAVLKLRDVRDRGIPVYVIAGSHDYSPTGKTMLDVLEKAGLFTNVSTTSEIREDGSIRLSFAVDKKTGAKITGISGRKTGLEKGHYEKLLKEELEKEDGFKIFMLHSGIEEYKPKHLEQMEAIPLSWFPKSFNYYAAGHIHSVFSRHEPGYGLIAFPGPLFPNSFDELERLGSGGFYIVEAEGAEWKGEKQITLNHVQLPIYNTVSIKIDCTGKTPGEVETEMLGFAEGKGLINTIVCLRLYGELKEGRTTDIRIKDVMGAFYGKGAHCVLKNSYALTSRFFEEIKVEAATVEDTEDALIKEHLGQIKVFDAERELQITRALMGALSAEKDEGERQADFEARVTGEAAKALGIKL